MGSKLVILNLFLSLIVYSVCELQEAFGWKDIGEDIGIDQLHEDGQSDVDVHLIVRKYVEKGSSVTLHCEHNVPQKILYKVTWLKSGLGKFFQYINGRNPPFRNFSIPGAEIDAKNSDDTQATLKNVDFEAAGLYSCEVSTDTPIFLKESREEQLHVILQQIGPPKISFSKRQFAVSEKLLANCTTSKARPAPKITWLINGIKVDDKHTRTLHFGSNGKSAHRSKSHQQNNPSYDKMESSGMFAKTSDFTKEEPVDSNGNHLGFEIHPNSGYDNKAFDTGNIMETFSDYFDDKFFESRKHRNFHNHKNRRHVNDLNNRNAHRTIASGSQLSIELSSINVTHSGRLEITCLATIPAHVGQGEQFTDYKTSSVKIDIDSTETTSLMPTMSGMAALGNSSNGTKLFNPNTTIIPICLPISVILIKLVHKRYGVQLF